MLRLPLLALSLTGSTIVLSFAACSTSESSPDGARDAGNDVVPDIDSRDAMDADGAVPTPLVELKEVCEHAGGQFREAECSCPAEQVTPIVSVAKNFDARNGGSCTRPEAVTSDCMARGGFRRVLETEGIDAMRACLQFPIYLLQRANVELRIPNEWSASTPAAADLALWLDTRFATPSTLYAKLAAPPDTVDSLRVFVGAKSISESSVALSFALPNVDPGNPDIAYSSFRDLHVPSVAELDWALGHTTVATGRPGRNASPPGGPDGLEASIETAIKNTRFDDTKAADAKTLLQRCLGMCDVTQDYTLTATSGATIHAWRTRRYQGGVVYRETLAVGSQDHRRVDGWVLFDLGGEPSFIFRVDHATRLNPVVSAFDRNWNALGTFRFDLFRDPVGADAARSASTPLGADETGVVLCDSGMTFDDAAVNRALLFGPNSVDTPRGSVFGWASPEPHDASGFLDGVRTTVLGVYPKEDYPNLHGKGMARLLLEGGGPIRILSTGIGRCLERPDWVKSLVGDANASKIRVVNVSGGDYFDEEACRARFPNGLDPSFLWVTASGNSGRKSEPDAPLARCPQLPRRDNLLVVSGMDGNRPWVFTDFGSTYSDLGADCSDNGRCTGSSNSAPRVSHTAALIVQKHGTAISNEMVRMAILLGVSLPTRVLPFRSGGTLHHDDAMRAAAALVDAGFGTKASLTADQAKSVLDALYPDREYANRKFATLQQNGAFGP